MTNFEEFYKKNYRNKVGLIKKFFRSSRDEAEDIVQEAFCRSVQYKDSYKPDLSSFNTWFNTILFNVARQYSKRIKFEDFKEERYETEELLDHTEVGRNIEIFTSNIKHKRILRLFYLLGYTSTEVSLIIPDVTISNITTVCHRFKQFLIFNNGDI